MPNKRWLLDLCEKAGKLAIIDIEATNLAASFGRILVVAVKPYGKKPVSFIAGSLADEKKMLADAVPFINQFEVTVGHFSTYFDIPFIATRLTYHKMSPEIELQLRFHVDTWKVARYNLKMHKNHLAGLCDNFHLSDKKEGLSPDEWIKVQEDFKGNIGRMRAYCEQDTRSTEALYRYIRHLAGDKVATGTGYSI